MPSSPVFSADRFFASCRARLWRTPVVWLCLLILAALADVRAAVPRAFVQLPPDPGAEPPEEPAMAVADEVLIRVRPGVVPMGGNLGAGWPGEFRWITPRRARALAGRGAERVIDQLGVVRLPPGTDLQEALQELSARPEVLYAEPNLRLEVTAREPEGMPVPNDFEFSRQWALHNTGQTGGHPGSDIGALEAWRISTGSSNIIAAIIDTGIDYFHPDLEPNMWRNPHEVAGNGIDDDNNGFIDDVFGYDFVSDDGDPNDDNVHGTHVAGILGAAGNDENGVAGVAWSIRLMALKAFDESGSGTLDDTIAAIGYATESGARIINASWGTTTRSRALDEVVAEAVRSGVVFVAAAGNTGSDVNFYPAAVPEALAVGATDASDGSASFSNYGPFIDLVAPGDVIHSTAPNATWVSLSGTSMAAPHVSGVVALLLSIQPDFTPEQVATILRSTAVELATDRYTGAGRVHAARAVQISEPLPDALLEVPSELSGTLDLRGTAAGNRFAGFRLEFGPGKRPETWQEIGSGGTPVTVGTLVAGFDTTAHDDGEYTLRLVVSNALGQAAIVRQPITIRNVRLSEPQNNDVLRAGDPVFVFGTVAGTGRTFEIAWGLGRHPTAWHTNGVELVRQGASPVINDILGSWDTRSMSSNAFVTLRLTARRGDRVVGEAYARMIHLEARLSEGWPRRLPFTDEFPVANWREFNVADLDGDGRMEIVLVDHGEPGGREPRLIVMDSRGRPLWMRKLPAGAPEHDAPVIGDLDGDGRMEILVDTGGEGLISAFDASGNPVEPGWPVAPGGTHFGKILADLDHDGRLELVAVSSPPPDLVSSVQRRLVVVGADGVIRRQWAFEGCDKAANAPEQLPAVANLDNDPDLEIVAVDGCHSVSAFDLTRGDAPIWTATTEAHLVASPVTGDLDGDGTEEVVIGGVSLGKGTPGGLYQFDRQGNLRDGWPILIEESFHSSAALADLDGDGWLDIVIPSWDSDRLHVVRADGFELRGWPVVNAVNATMRAVPVIGDVDGDRWPDVVLPSPGHWLNLVLTGDTTRAGGVRAWRADGSLIDFHPGSPPEGLVLESSAGTDWRRFPPAVIADLDGDGFVNVVASTTQDLAYSPTPPPATPKMRSTLYAWDLPVPAEGDAFPWPAFQGGPSRTGRYYRPPPPNAPPILSPIPSQTIAVGGEYRTVPLDRYVDDADHERNELEWSVRGATELLFLISLNRVLTIVPPRPDWEGREEVELVVRDPAGAEASVSVVFSAIPDYRPPVARPDVLETMEEMPILFSPLANDESPTQRPLRIASVSRSAGGTTELLPDNRVRYTPHFNFFGEDTFEYTLLDDDGGIAVGEVRIHVEGVNDPPTPVPDRLILDEDTAVDFEPLENDFDVDLDDLRLLSIDQPEKGRLEALGGSRFRFVPPLNYNGVQSFRYLVGDPAGLTATGEVAILVKPVNDPPVLEDQTITLNRNRSADVFYAASDADGDTLRFTIIQPPSHGVLLSYPTLANYAPEKGYVGTDSFTYRASDGLAEAGPARVGFVIDDANNAPDVEPVMTVTAQAQPLTIGLHAGDADGDPVTLSIATGPAHGTVLLEGTNAVYTPDADFVGEDLFTFRASDGMAVSAEAEVKVRVTDENTAPRAESEVLTVPRNQSSPLKLRAWDAENNPLQFLVVTNPFFGRIEGTPPELTYTPPGNFRGVDRLHFIASDGMLTSHVAVVHLLVRDPNAVPVVSNQTIRVRRDQPMRIRLDATDADLHPLRAVILKGPQSGRLYGQGIEFTYVPRAGFQGRDTFTYKVWDGFAYSAQGAVTLQVEDVEPLPLAITAVEMAQDGFAMFLQGEPGIDIEIEFSSDLTDWEHLATAPNPLGATRWVDVAAWHRGSGFYRITARAGTQAR